MTNPIDTIDTPNRPTNLLNHFYTILPNFEESDTFTVEVIDADSDFLGWKFKINKLNFPDSENEEKPVEEHQITVDYDVLPSVDNVLEECYNGKEDHPLIIDCLSTIVLDVLQQAVRAQKFSVLEENAKKRGEVYKDVADQINFLEIENDENGENTESSISDFTATQSDSEKSGTQ